MIGILNAKLEHDAPRLLGIRSREREIDLREFVAELLQCTDPAILGCIQLGLPLEALATLPHGAEARCRVCGGRMQAVPCGRCSQQSTLHKARPDKQPLKQPKTPTAHPPGSQAKVEVMRERVARGESPFHPLDFTPHGGVV